MVLCNFYLCTNLWVWSVTLVSNERYSFIPGPDNLVSKWNSCTVLFALFRKYVLSCFYSSWFHLLPKVYYSFALLIAIFKCWILFGHTDALILSFSWKYLTFALFSPFLLTIDAVFNFQFPFQLVWTAYLPSFPFIVPSTISKAWHNRKAFGELIHLGTFSLILVLWFQSLSHGIYYNGIFQTTLATCVSN